ncbi:MAG: hypothetical protein N2749_06215 [Clostridia bacterium]|nr:hypothetical protein [Clostridia bacterium]
MFDYNDLVESENIVQNLTAVRLKGFYNDFPKFVDLAFYFQQSFGELDEVTTEMGELQSIAFMHFVQLPYTLRLIYSQIINGYYIESQILIRSLFETLVQLKYFCLYPSEIKNHYTKNIKINKMIEGITKKPLYKRYRHLSAYAHGFLMKDLHRTDRKENRTYLGNRYLEDYCTVPMNYIIDIMLGFINIYHNIFIKNNMHENDLKIKTQKYIRDWCILSRTSHMEHNPESKNMHDSMDDLIN